MAVMTFLGALLLGEVPLGPARSAAYAEDSVAASGTQLNFS
jgi:hypothetical protein